MNKFSILAAALTAGVLSSSVSVQAKPASYTLTIAPDLSAYYASVFSGGTIKFLGDYDATTSIFTATSATGTINGYTITGLSPYAYSDQLLYSTPNPFVDYSGPSVVTNHLVNGVYEAFNNFYDPSAIRGPYNLINNITSPSGFEDSNTLHVVDNGAVGGIPEPALWALYVGGFGLVGVTLRRRSPRSVTA